MLGAFRLNTLSAVAADTALDPEAGLDIDVSSYSGPFATYNIPHASPLPPNSDWGQGFYKQSTVLAFDFDWPVTPTEGGIWEVGGGGIGAYIGFWDDGSGVKLIATGGDGGQTYSASTSDTAVCNISDYPKDGGTHTLVVEYRGGVNDDFAPSNTYGIRVWIDGVLKAQEQPTSGIWKSNDFSGGNGGAYLKDGMFPSVAGPYPSNLPGLTNASDMRVYWAQFVTSDPWVAQ